MTFDLNFLPSWPLSINAMMVFGLLILVGLLGGYAAAKTRFLPRITGFIAIGFLMGPSGLGLFDQQVLDFAKHFVQIALGLILFQMGRLLDIRHALQERPLIAAALLESTLSFGLIFTALSLIGLDPLHAALAGAIGISSSPAVVMLVVRELGAKGPMTERALMLVAINNILAFLVFTSLLPLLHYSQAADWDTILLQPAYRLLSSLVLAYVLARLLLFLAARFGRDEGVQFALILGTIVGAVGLAVMLKASFLLTLLSLGVLSHNLDRGQVLGKMDFGHVTEIFFVILFVSAGANLHIDDLAVAGWAAVAFVLARMAGKSLGVMVLAPAVLSRQKAGLMGLMLLPMAGMAIGLTQSAANLYPEFATTLSAIVLGAITILETVGPIATEYALKKSGEVPADAKVEH